MSEEQVQQQEEEISYNVSHSKIGRWAKKEGWVRPTE
jgi:hypothetical protein